MKKKGALYLIYAIAFVIVLSLVLYVVYLLFSNYRSQAELRKNLVTQLKQETEMRSTSIEYFFYERKDDVVNLALNSRIYGYFDNKNLGMSKEYGLNISLFQIRELFIDLMKRKQVEKDRIYSRIVLIDRDGSVLVDVLGEDQQRSGPKNWQALLDPAGRNGVITASHDRKEIVVSASCYHKDKYTGQIVAWIRPEIIINHLLKMKSTATSLMFLVTQEGNHFLSLGATPSSPPLSMPELLSLRTGEIKEFESRSGGSVIRKRIALRIPVENTHFSLMNIVDAREAFGEVNPERLLMNMVIQALVIFTGLFFTFILMARHMILQTRLEESTIRERDVSEKNRQLEIEILERKRAEEAMLTAMEAAEAASRAKSLFLANMSHEIRTPMSGVLGMAGLLLETSLTDRQRGYVDKIRKSGGWLLIILNNVLDFAKINAGKLTLATNPFSMKEVFDHVARIFGPPIADKGLKLNTILDPELPPALLGDHPRLIQLISNLMENAVKFTDAGEIRFAVKIRQRTEERVELEISVKDEGIGIREEDLSRLFKVFSQADDSLARRHGGSGMGLAISRSLAELMGGMLQAESAPGKGSTFSAIIPFPVATGEAKAYAKLDVMAIPPPAPDMEEGLKRVGGNRELYLKLLADFIAGYGEAPAQLVQELRADRRDEAVLRIQALRRVAGDLGGKELEAAAKELEKACRTAGNGVPFALGEPLRVFIDHHEAFIAAIGAVFSQHPSVISAKADGPSGNIAELLPLLKKLRKSLESEEPQPCNEILATLLRKRWSESHEDILTELSRLIKRYRLAEALEFLDREFKDIIGKKEK